MKFGRSKVGIIGGKGRMGAWFGRLLEEHGLEVVYTGRSTRISPRETVERCEVIVVSVPISATLQVIQDVGPLMPKDGLLMDLTSVKKAPVEAMLRYSRSQVVGLHPLFGPAPESKDLGIVLCPARGEEGRVWITDIFRKSGIRVVSLEPEAHDRMMGLIQGVNHFSTLALALCIRDSGYGMKELYQCATDTFRRRLDRIRAMLDQPSGLFGSLLMDNQFTGDFIETSLASCERLKRIISHGDRQAFEGLLESLNRFFGREERES
jgi:prephenate dehydrogenase